MHYLKNNKRTGWLWIIIIILLSSCTKGFKDMNTNPNALPGDRLNWDNVYLGGFFKQMGENVIPLGINDYQVVQNLAGDIFGGYNGQTHNWNAAGDNTTYNFSIGWNGAAYNIFYSRIIKNYDTISKYSANNPDIIAVARIIKVAAAHRMVDMYGPVPYFKTQGSLGSGAVYDPMDSIYYSFFRDIDSATTTLKKYISLGVNTLKNFDPIYRGNYRQWVQFANALKLRLAMRIVYAEPEKARGYAEAAVSDPSFLITTKGDNATLQGTEGVTYTNPLWGVTDAYQEARMSANMESFLMGYADPRLPVYFQPSKIAGDPSGVYRGIRSGSIIADGLRYQPFSMLQYNYNLVWMSAAEVSFLRAEGALRGWNMGGTAQQFYEAGITASFDQWGVSGAAGYIANSTNKPRAYTDPVNGTNNVAAGDPILSTITIKWDEAGSFEKNLEQVITQKWIAMYPNGQEAWSEFRRTGYPKIFPIKSNKGNDPRLNTIQVKRLPYPASEYQNNNINVIRGVTLLGGTDLGGTKLWWDKKP